MMNFIFDMDGTLADFYGVENWLQYLIERNPFPYEVAKPLVNMSALARRLHTLQRKRNENRYTAEVIYRFLTNCNDFVEEHTGLADCMIEKDIFSYCLVTISENNGYLW